MVRLIGSPRARRRTALRVVVTGCSSGIGLATAEELAARGHEVIATARSDAGAARVAELAQRFPSLRLERLDVTDGEQVDHLFERLGQEGRLDALVNNAGIAISGFVEHLSEDDYRAVMEANFFAPVHLSRSAYAIMRRQGSGTVVQVSSGAGRIGLPLMSAYAASKHALSGFSESFAVEASASGVRVVLLELGNHRTAMQLGGSPVRGSGTSGGEVAARLAGATERLVDRHGADPSSAANAIARWVEHPSPPFRRPVGIDARLLLLAVRALPGGLLRSASAHTLRRAGHSPQTIAPSPSSRSHEVSTR